MFIDGVIEKLGSSRLTFIPKKVGLSKTGASFYCVNRIELGVRTQSINLFARIHHTNPLKTMTVKIRFLPPPGNQPYNQIFPLEARRKFLRLHFLPLVFHISSPHAWIAENKYWKKLKSGNERGGVSLCITNLYNEKRF